LDLFWNGWFTSPLRPSDALSRVRGVRVPVCLSSPIQLGLDNSGIYSLSSLSLFPSSSPHPLFILSLPISLLSLFASHRVVQSLYLLCASTSLRSRRVPIFLRLHPVIFRRVRDPSILSRPYRNTPHISTEATAAS
jgi:hypothetical protein